MENKLETLGSVPPYPKHLERHKRVYERVFIGREKQVDIAKELGISSGRVGELILRWKRELERIEQRTNGICPYCGHKNEQTRGVGDG